MQRATIVLQVIFGCEIAMPFLESIKRTFAPQNPHITYVILWLIQYKIHGNEDL